jgi:hypothetical protein
MQHADELRGKYSEIAKKRWDKPGARKTLEERRDMPQCYILYCFNDREEFIKVGITTTTVSRRYSKGMGSYKFEVLIQFFSNSYIDIESQISSILSENRYKPHKKFPGYLECYTVDSLDLVKDFNQSDISERCVADALQMRCDAVKERKRKENESKGNDLDDAGAHAHTQEDIDAFEKFQKWILRNAPSVMKMVQPFKIEEYLSIRDNIPPDKVSDLLQRMDNRKDLLKNNKSAYRTLLNWSKNEWNKPATNIASTTAGLKQL